MAHSCPTCGEIRHSTYTRGTLVAQDEPFEIYREGRIIRLSPSQAVVVYELVRRGRISRDRIYELARRADAGTGESLPGVRIMQIKERLAAAGASERITAIRGWGYQLETA